MAGEWVTAAAEALERLTEPHREKKAATIIALVDARLAGRSEESIWGQPGVCNRRTYHTKWKHDPDFAGALAEATRLATRWKNERALMAIQEAAERLALASPAAVERLVKLVQSDDEAVALRASTAVLDRAGVETASKGRSTVEVEVAEGARERLARLLGAVIAEGGEGEGSGAAER